MKTAYVTVDKLHHLSGFGWDDNLKMVKAVDAVWEELLKVSSIGFMEWKLNLTFDITFESEPSYSHWRKTPFPFYDDFAYLVDGIVATGKEVFNAAEPEVPPSGEGDNDNPSEVESDGTPSYHSGMKRSCSPQHEAPFKRQRVRKTSSARALSDMSDAICSMIDYLREPDHISHPAP